MRFLFLMRVRVGIRSWDVDLTSCNLDEQLKLFVSRHSAFFSEELKESTVLCGASGDGGLAAGAGAVGFRKRLYSPTPLYMGFLVVLPDVIKHSVTPRCQCASPELSSLWCSRDVIVGLLRPQVLFLLAVYTHQQKHKRLQPEGIARQEWNLVCRFEIRRHANDSSLTPGCTCDGVALPDLNSRHYRPPESSGVLHESSC
ncbi:hypothetical protein NFI96_001647 [Prochilodus magdalenae]|nr:hypothetical protein NFI96_001647 [Prochilodus magdalenae]